MSQRLSVTLRPEATPTALYLQGSCHLCLMEAECSCLCSLHRVSSLDSELTMAKEEPTKEGPGPWGGGVERLV